MSKYIVILKIPVVNKEEILNSIKNIYSKSDGKQFAHKGDILQYIFKINSSDTDEIIITKLEEISNLSVISVNLDLDIRSKIPKKYSSWLMFGLLFGWVSITYVAFFIPNNVIDTFTSSQLVVVQISIALVISIWIFIYDKRTQQDVIDVLATLDLRTSEINENIKDLDGSR